MYNLRFKLLAPFILGTLALTVVLAWYAYSSARRALEDAMLLISEAKTEQSSGAMSFLQRSILTAAQNMVTDQRIRDLFTEPMVPDPAGKIADWLDIVIQGNDYYRDILLVDRTGKCIASSNLGYIGVSYADRDYVRRALSGLFNFGEASVGRLTKKFTATAAGPIDGPHGIAGALILICDLPKVVNYESDSVHSERAVFTALLSPDGLFAAHRDRNIMGRADPAFKALYDNLSLKVGERGGAVNYTLFDKAYVGYAEVENIGKWLVVTSGVTGEVFAPAYRVGMVLFGLSLLFLCVVSLVVFRFADNILQALLSLVSYAKRVSEGDLELKLEPSTRRDELGILHNSLRNLVDVLQDMIRKTQEASKMKGEFLANMSHEIRTPLNAIIGMAHLSLRDGDLSPKQHSYLEKIRMAARSLLGVINDILDISKIEAGMLVVERSRFNLKETVENSLAIHQESAKAKELSLALEYAEDAPRLFMGDTLRIGQVLNNLIGNAVKFTDAGGITVHCRRDGEQETDDGAIAMRISVTDSGIGMTQGVIDTLFKPFTQADASITRRFGGTGLGLAISSRIVEMLGGAFRVESEPGHGTTFSFFVKLPPAEQQQKKAEEELPLSLAFEKLDLSARRILVAEDNEINRFILEEMLAPTGVNLFMAANGQEAVDAVKEQNFDLVLMDMQMPVMDGLEATRVIRSLEQGRDVPIVAVTANAMEDDKAKGLACGMSDYLTKPIEPAELLRVLHLRLGPAE